MQNNFSFDRHRQRKNHRLLPRHRQRQGMLHVPERYQQGCSLRLGPLRRFFFFARSASLHENIRGKKKSSSLFLSSSISPASYAGFFFVSVFSVGLAV